MSKVAFASGVLMPMTCFHFSVHVCLMTCSIEMVVGSQSLKGSSRTSTCSSHENQAVVIAVT
jgi:hypothetical protein